jgi:hypothetical protein
MSARIADYFRWPEWLSGWLKCAQSIQYERLSGHANQKSHRLSARHPRSVGAVLSWLHEAGRADHQAATSIGVWLLTIIFSPVILVAGEPLNQYVMRRVRRSAAAGLPAATHDGDPPTRAVAIPLSAAASLLMMVISNPLWIALTAPGRWVRDQFCRQPSTRAGTAAR